MSPEEIFPRCSSTPFRRGRDTMPLQNVGDRVTSQFVTQVGQGTLHSQITPGLVFRSETDNERGNLSIAVRGRPGARYALPSYFWAINFRCQANNVAGVTIVATCSRIFRLSFLALAAKRQRWLFVNRILRFPICSRRTRFSSMRSPSTEPTFRRLSRRRRETLVAGGCG